MVNINFTSFPVLTTDRLTLRQLTGDDGQSIFALRSSAEVNKYLGRQPAKTIEDATAFISMINDNIKKNNSVYWAITLTGTKTFVGTICLFDFSSEKNSCEIGYELMPEFQGQGIMQEAAKKVIDYAFGVLQFREISAFTHIDNRGSTGLLEKFDFIKSGAADNENPDFNIFILSDSD